MLTKKQLDILAPLTKNPFKALTRQQIKEQAEENSNNQLAKTLSKLKTLELINEKKVGKTYTYTPNLDNHLYYPYLEIINFGKLPEIIQQSIKRIKRRLYNETTWFSIIIFGSYANNEATDESDLDVAILTDNEENKKRIEKGIYLAKQQTLPEIDALTITEKEMLEMLNNQEANLAKLIATKHLAIHGSERYYELLRKSGLLEQKETYLYRARYS